MTIYDVTNGCDDSKFLHQLKSYNKIPLLVHLHKFFAFISVLSCENKKQFICNVDSVAIFAQDMTLNL